MFAPLRKIGRSISFKLILTFVATAVVLVLVVAAILRSAIDGSPHRELIGKNLAQYATFIADGIGSPPDVDVARNLAGKLGVAMSIQTPTGEWLSEPEPMTHLPTALNSIPGYPNVSAARYRGQLFIKVDRPAAEYLLVFGKHGMWKDRKPAGVLLLVLVAIGTVLTLSYLAVRWLFKPLGWLTGGMSRMGTDRLDVTIPVREHDELGDIARTFNQMAARIRDLVRAKQQLLRDVSHELRSPMTRMKLAAELIEDDKVKKLINADLDEMEAMTAEILESERLASEQGSLTFESVDLTGLVKQIAETQVGQKPGVKMLTSKPALVQVDRERIVIVFRNMIDNALKYSREQERPVEVSVHPSSDGTLVVIEDFGQGIPQPDQSLIFEPFYRVDKSRHKKTGGYGLGLSLCMKIMKAHGGNIEVDSEPGKGSRFTIVFPTRR